MMMKTYKWDACEGDWRNETESWFQRWGEAKRNELLVIFKQEDSDGESTDKIWTICDTSYDEMLMNTSHARSL